MSVDKKKAKVAQAKKPQKKTAGNIYHETKRVVTSATDEQQSLIVSYTSRIRAIGNSQGIILNNKIMETVGLKTNTEINLRVENGSIIISKIKQTDINTDLSTWDEHFKNAIKKGALPEGDMFEGLVNEFDLNEW